MTPEERWASDLADEDAAANARGIIVPSALTNGEAACVKCRDIGWLNMPATDPRLPGTMVPCECRKFNAAAKWVGAVAGASAVRAYTFESFNLALNPPMADAFGAAQAFVGEGAPPWLVLVGPWGCGKTHLAIAACRVLVGVGWGIAYYTGPGAMDALKAGMNRAENDGAMSYEDTRQRLEEIPLLLLDEFDMLRKTDWTVERMDQILGNRYQKGLRTVIVANKLESLGARLETRVQDRRVCRLALCCRWQGDTPIWADDIRPRLQGRAG